MTHGLRVGISLSLLVATGCSGGNSPDRALPTPTPTPRPMPTPCSAALPRPLTEVAATLWRGRIAVIGGYTADRETVPDVYLLDAARCAWSRGPDLPQGRNHAAAVVRGDRLFVIGGFGPEAGAGRSVFSLGPSDRTWRAEPVLRTARAAHAAAVVGGTIAVFGGVRDSGTREDLASTELLRGDAAAWQPGPDLAVARDHLAGAAQGTRVLAIGGRTGSLTRNLATVEGLELGETAPQWRPLASLRVARGGIDADVVGRRVCVAGGEEPDGTIGDIECLDGGRWAVVGRLRQPRHGLAAVAVDGTLHLVAGGPRPGLSVSDTHETIRP